MQSSAAALAVLTLTATILVAPAIAAQKCVIADAAVEKAGGYAKAVEATVKEAPNCKTAYTVFEACQLGSSADNALSSIVQEKCEVLFMGKANGASRHAYKMALNRCDNIAKKKEGSMYQGFAAVCRAKAARDFAIEYAKKPALHL